MTNTMNTPIEALEMTYPVRIAEYGLRRGSGGQGRHSGGDGIVRRWEFLAPATLTIVSERRRFGPWGLAGGKAAAVNALIVNPDTPEAESIKKVNAKPIKAGSRISVRTGGGGGHGNPFERDLELVRLDVVRGYVSREAAQRDYGVVLQPGTLDINVEETQQLRAQGR